MTATASPPVWASRPAAFNAIATRTVIAAEQLARAADVHHGDRVLDVAAGTGNCALAAARRGARVVATDLVADMLDVAVRRAVVEGLELQVQTADAQDLPFDADRFDVVLSSFGAIFGRDHRRTADELIRVCRPGGRIGLLTWPPDSAVARVQRILATYAPTPPEPGPSSLSWGDEQYCRDLFGARAAALTATRHRVEHCAATVSAHVEFLRQHLAPVRSAFAALGAGAQQGLAADLAATLELSNRATDGTFVGEMAYLQVIVTVA
jgi:SAM-dependent methyltransferase